MSKSSFLIREIEQKDNAQIEALIYKVFREFKLPMEGSSIQDDEIPNMYEAYKSKTAVYYVIEESGEVFGGAGIKQLKGVENKICELQKMYFLPEVRGKGYGKIMFDTCIKAAKDLGYKQCYLESASQLEAAVQMYEKNGFKTLDKPIGKTGHYVCGVWMIKDLI